MRAIWPDAFTLSRAPRSSQHSTLEERALHVYLNGLRLLLPWKKQE